MDRVLDILENFQDYKAHIISLENLSLSQKNMTFFNAKGVISLLIHLITPFLMQKELFLF